MSIIPYQHQGQTYYTHSSWLSEKQRRAMRHIPVENNKLQVYYAASLLSLAIIGKNKIAPIASIFSRFGAYAGTAILGGIFYIPCFAAMMLQTAMELSNIPARNDCGVTPFWKNPEGVVNLKSGSANDQVLYNSRTQGKQLSNDLSTSDIEDIKKYKPDLVI